MKPKTPKKPDLTETPNQPWNHPKNIARNIGKLWRIMPEQEVEITETNATPVDAASGQTVSFPARSRANGQRNCLPLRIRADESELAKLSAERDQLVDRLARLQAEFENARKRAEREKAEFRDFATGSVVENFLPVLDNFELALKATGSADQLRSGVELIVKQMDEALRQLNVTAIPTVGEPFDPRFHEALGSVERDDLPDHTVAEEIRRATRFASACCARPWSASSPNPKQVAE